MTCKWQPIHKLFSFWCCAEVIDLTENTASSAAKDGRSFVIRFVVFGAKFMLAFVYLHQSGNVKVRYCTRFKPVHCCFKVISLK